MSCLDSKLTLFLQINQNTQEYKKVMRIPLKVGWVQRKGEFNIAVVENSTKTLSPRELLVSWRQLY